MPNTLAHLRLITALCLSIGAQVSAKPANQPGCAQQTPKQCVGLAIEAMGGVERLQQIKGISLRTIGHTLLMEQSYRQAPFITSYDRVRTTLDLGRQLALIEKRVTWPENDFNQPDDERIVVVGPEGGVNRGKSSDSPCSLSDLMAARQEIALGPLRVLRTASEAADLHFETPQVVRSTFHSVVAFTWNGIPVRVLLNPFNHLPDAVRTIQQFRDFWYFWGDVTQCIYFDNWRRVQGVSYPTNLVEERNGAVWRSTQALDVKFNPETGRETFTMNAAIAQQSAKGVGWNRPFHADKDTVLAPGIDLFVGSWNAAIIKQPDGIIVLEVPISGRYAKEVIDEARKRYPGLPIKAVLSTSDSWPHVGGVRFAVAEKLPVFILDLNQTLLDRMVAAPHKIDPDDLEALQVRAKPRWEIVSGKLDLGSGDTRLQMYPLRGASTERQYMVYFPEHRILYASDTLVVNDDGTLYDPELLHEVVAAVKRENLEVDTVFAMHQTPITWGRALELLAKSEQ